MGSYKGLKLPIFETEPRYNPGEEELKATLYKLKEVLSANLGRKVQKLTRLGIGQNVNFKVCTEGNEGTAYLLRAITINGYPSIDTLDECYRLLGDAQILHSRKKYFDKSGDIVPYGYLVQEWIDGDDATLVYGEDDEDYSKWLKDFVQVLKKVHTIKLPYFGYLEDGPKFESLRDYYYNMDSIIDNSYGNVFKNRHTIWDLEKYSITTPGFLKFSFDSVKGLADMITSPAQSVLVHGDMLPQNLIYTNKGITAIDWDEARANWWVYEIARTSFYMGSKGIIDEFVKMYGDTSVSLKDVYLGVKLEHIRQMLRYLFIAAFNCTDVEAVKAKVKGIENEIKLKIQEKLDI